MNNIKNYFSYSNKPKLEGNSIYELLTETSILEAEDLLSEEDIDVSNVYFKLLAQVNYLENEFEKNKREIAYIYYLIGYYVGLFLHPFNGDEIALSYINKAVLIETDEQKIEKYKKTILMIEEKI